MRNIILGCFLIGSLGVLAQEEAPNAMIRNSHRVLWLVGNKPEDPKSVEMRKRFRAEEAKVNERDVEIKDEWKPDGTMHKYYKVKGWTAILIGKDGHEKWRKEKLFEPSELFTQIDKMPMRQAEKK